MDWNPTRTRTVDLGYEQMLVLESHQRTRIKVIYGGVWLTEEREARDVFASGGEEISLKSRGLAVVEGLGRARVQVMEPLVGWHYLAGVARSAKGALASWARRLPLTQQGPAGSQQAS
jgi:hypothetical protein